MAIRENVYHKRLTKDNINEKIFDIDFHRSMNVMSTEFVIINRMAASIIMNDNDKWTWHGRGFYHGNLQPYINNKKTENMEIGKHPFYKDMFVMDFNINIHPTQKWNFRLFIDKAMDKYGKMIKRDLKDNEYVDVIIVYTLYDGIDGYICRLLSKNGNYITNDRFNMARLLYEKAYVLAMSELKSEEQSKQL